MSLAPMQVKLLKCLVDNIVVDISFDTIGWHLHCAIFGVNRQAHVGQEHLFKRSIILVNCLLISAFLWNSHPLFCSQ